jgi:AcrR family transcriptional regulator
MNGFRVSNLYTDWYKIGMVPCKGLQKAALQELFTHWYKNCIPMTERGRPRAFDREEALAKAMQVFWSQGYEGASMGELTEAMGINKPSLYAAFGCKEALFREAVQYYNSVECIALSQALQNEPTARAAIEAVLRINAGTYVSSGTPPGCMVVVASMRGAAENAEVRSFLMKMRKDGQLGLAQRIERGIRDKDVPAKADAAKLAAYYTTVIHGLSIQALDGASAEELQSVVDCAMASWDTLVR